MSEGFIRPRPISTMTPTTDRTIWWQNDDAVTSKRSSRSETSGSPFRYDAVPQLASITAS